MSGCRVTDLLKTEMEPKIIDKFVPLLSEGFRTAHNEGMAKKNKLASIIADLNYEYLSVVAKLCGEPVDTLIDRIVERAASKKKPAAKKKSSAPRTIKSVRAA